MDQRSHRVERDPADAAAIDIAAAHVFSVCGESGNKL
jgi:hypothetical protein